MIKKILFAVLGIAMLFIVWLIPSTASAEQGEIKLTVGSKGWFRVEKLTGANISVKGMPSNFTAQIGSNIKQDYTANPNSVITFKGNITGLRIVGELDEEYNVKKRADIVQFDASKAPKSLKSLSLKGLNLKDKSNTINLSGATELVGLGLIDLSAGVTIPLLDLSKQTKVKTLFLGNPNYNNAYIKEVRMPKKNVIENLDLSRCWIQKIDVSHLPELEKFTAVGTGTIPVVDLSGSPKLRIFTSYRAHIKSYILKNMPNLRLAKFGGNEGANLTIENCPKLHQIHTVTDQNGKKYTLGLWLEKSDGDEPDVIKFKKISLKNVGITKLGGGIADGLVAVKDLDLTGNPIKEIDFSDYSKLKKVKMSIDKLPEGDFDKVINSLPTLKDGEKATFEVSDSGNVSSDKLKKFKDKLLAKGWNKNTSALEEITEVGAKVYPTETSDLVRIEGAKVQTPYAVFAMNGTLCERGHTDELGSAELHLASYAKGIYIIRLGAQYQKVSLR